MPVKSALISFISDQLEGTASFETRRMFGCVGLICEFGMFGLIDPSEALYFRADDENHQEFLDQHCEKFTYQTSRNGNRVTTSLRYFLIPADDIENRVAIARWASLGLDSARRSIRMSAKKARPTNTDPLASLWGL